MALAEGRGSSSCFAIKPCPITSHFQKNKAIKQLILLIPFISDVPKGKAHLSYPANAVYHLSNILPSLQRLTRKLREYDLLTSTCFNLTALLLTLKPIEQFQNLSQISFARQKGMHADCPLWQPSLTNKTSREAEICTSSSPCHLLRAPETPRFSQVHPSPFMLMPTEEHCFYN